MTSIIAFFSRFFVGGGGGEEDAVPVGSAEATAVKSRFWSFVVEAKKRFAVFIDEKGVAIELVVLPTIKLGVTMLFLIKLALLLLALADSILVQTPFVTCLIPLFGVLEKHRRARGVAKVAILLIWIVDYNLI